MYYLFCFRNPRPPFIPQPPADVDSDSQVVADNPLFNRNEVNHDQYVEPVQEVNRQDHEELPEPGQEVGAGNGDDVLVAANNVECDRNGRRHIPGAE